MKIGIIGGGITGLVSAYTLSKKGHQITLFDSKNEVGGLASGFKLHGYSIEKAYHHFFRSDIHLIKLLEELGLEEKILWLDSSTAIYTNNTFFDFTSPKDLLFFKPLSILNRIRTGIVFLYLKLINSWGKFEEITAKEWLVKWNGSEAYRVLWEPIIKGKFHSHADQISMAWFWGRIHSRSSSRDTSGETLGYLDGGFTILIDKLVEKIINAGGIIKTKSALTSINKEPSGKLVLEVESNKTEDSTTGVTSRYVFDKVITTIPSSTFANILDSNDDSLVDYKKKLNYTNYIGAITMLFTSKLDLTPDYWTNINDLDAPFLAIINHTKLTGANMYKDKNGKLVNIYYLAGYYPHDSNNFMMNDSELRKSWISYLSQITKQENLVQKIKDVHIYRFKNAQHVVPINYQGNILDTQTPIPNLYLSNFSMIYPWDRGVNWAVRAGSQVDPGNLRTL